MAILPSGYQEVEYIQSSGTQYIDTGYIPSNNTKIECIIGGWNTGTGQYGTIFGTRLEWSTSGRGFMLDYDSTNSRVLYMFGGGYNPNVGFSFPSGGKHTIEFSSGGVYEDGTLRFTPSSATFTSPVNLTLFALNNNGTVGEFGGFDAYSFKIRDNGTLVRDFIPCYRKSDDEIGLYDLVNNQFYSNSGTGSFIKGADILPNWKIQRIYVGTNQVRPKKPTFNFTYSFVSKSISTVQSDGWSFPAGTSGVSFDVNGMYKNSSGWRCGIYPIDLDGATKITVVATWYNIQTDVDMNAGIGQGVDSNGNVLYGCFIYRGYNRTDAYIAGGGKNNWGKVTGSYTTNMVLDIPNATAKFIVGSSIDWDYSLTSSDITTILQSSYLNCAVVKTNNRLKDISITIEY